MFDSDWHWKCFQAKEINRITMRVHDWRVNLIRDHFGINKLPSWAIDAGTD